MSSFDFHEHDLLTLHTLLTITGVLLAVYLMQLTRHYDEDSIDPWIIRKARSIGLALLALTFCWSASYSYAHGWQPWAPDVAIVAVVDLVLTVRIAGIWARIRRTGDLRCFWRRDKLCQSATRSRR